MKNRTDFVFPERSFHQLSITDIAAHHRYLLQQAATNRFTLGNPVAHEADDVRAGFLQSAGKPAPD